MNQHAHRDDLGARLGMWLFLLTELLLFGGLFILYAVYLARYPREFHSAGRELDVVFGAANTVVLLTSSLTAALALSALQRGAPRRAIGLLAATVGCAGIFMVNKYFEWSAKIHHGLYPGAPRLVEGQVGESVFFSLYYLTTGLHGLHVLVGAGLLGWVAAGINAGRIDAQRHVALENGALYWHLVDLVWIFIFPLYYLVL